MNMNIKGTRISLTPAIEDYVEKRLSALDKFIGPADDSVFVQVEVGKTTAHHKSGDVFRAEVNLSVGGKKYYAVSEKPDLYAAIDDVRDEILAELRKMKDKKSSTLRRVGARIKDALRGFKK